MGNIIDNYIASGYAKFLHSLALFAQLAKRDVFGQPLDCFYPDRAELYKVLGKKNGYTYKILADFEKNGIIKHKMGKGFYYDISHVRKLIRKSEFYQIHKA